MTIKNGKARGRTESVAEFEERRAKHLAQTKPYWACACGSAYFKLMGSDNNFKSVCTVCGDTQILAWYPDAHDSSAGSVRDVITGKWRAAPPIPKGLWRATGY